MRFAKWFEEIEKSPKTWEFYLQTALVLGCFGLTIYNIILAIDNIQEYKDMSRHLMSPVLAFNFGVIFLINSILVAKGNRAAEIFNICVIVLFLILTLIFRTGLV